MKKKVIRKGGVKYTIKDGIVYDAKKLLADVKKMVDEEKKKRAGNWFSQECRRCLTPLGCLPHDFIINYPICCMEYIIHLGKDRKLKKLIEKVKPYKLVKRKNICTYLCASIMSQQLSTKVADVIYKRFINLYGGKEPTRSRSWIPHLKH